jgi:hypothetical protein
MRAIFRINLISEKQQFKKNRSLTITSGLRNNEQNKNIPRQQRKGKLVTKTPPRRRPPKVDTERALAMRSCARHLKDLRRAHKQPPTEVEVNLRGVPRFVPPVIEQSYCTSPAALCAELAETARMEVVEREPVEAEMIAADMIDAETLI